jgi:hypothetical protein
MRPWQHARASALRGGRAWEEDLAIHEFVDRTKASLADLRHRMVLHNEDLGPALARMAFATLPHAELVARQHAREDLRAPVTLSWWLGQCDPDGLPRARDREPHDALVALAQRRFGLRDPDGPRAVLSLLTLPERLAPEHGLRARAVLANDAGISLVRAVLGPPRPLPGLADRSVVFDPAHCAEAMVSRWYRRVPSLRELADALRPQHETALDELSRRAPSHRDTLIQLP